MPGEIIAEASRDLNDEALLESDDIQHFVGMSSLQGLRFEKEQGKFFEGTPRGRAWFFVSSSFVEGPGNEENSLPRIRIKLHMLLWPKSASLYFIWRAWERGYSYYVQ